MREPDWSRLPFSTAPDEWVSYCETATAAEAMDLIRADSSVPMVWLERAALAAFARAAGITPAAALTELGAGVLRWWRDGCSTLPVPLKDGQCAGEVRFRGARELQLSVGRLGNDLLLHLPR